MKFLKATNWIRLRGQVVLNSTEVCKIDTPISNVERVFFVPETEDEKEFLKIDNMLGLTGLPVGPTTHNVDDDWGWRLGPEATEEEMTQFTEHVEQTWANVRGLKANILNVQKKNNTLN